MEYDRNLAPTGRKNTNQRQPNPSARPAQEAPDPKIVARLEEYLVRHEDASVSIVRSPLEEFRADICGFSRQEASGFFGPYSYSAWCAIESGARESLPSEVGKTLTRIGGPYAAARFEQVWRRWRAQIGREAIEAAEKKLFPGGTAYGMCE